MQTTYKVEGMHCQSCVRKIEQALQPFADGVQVDLAAGQVALTNARGDVSNIALAVAAAGHYQLSAPLPANDSHKRQSAALPETGTSYYPLMLIFAYIGIVSLAGAATAQIWMQHVMAGFFLTFSFFKLLNLRDFADSYAMYDLIAARSRGYGYIYPFCELGLGLAYAFEPIAGKGTLWATIALMGVSSLGVLRSMLKRQAIRCACLGNVINLPVSTVTLIEDLGMAVMALAMLVY